MSETKLPSYLADAKPNKNRAPWYKNTAPAYAGIILWFVFWQNIVSTGTPGGALAYGIALPILAIIVTALIAHFFYHLVPGLFGMKTGYGLAVVGSSVFGAKGGTFMPGLLMGLLQFGWLSVNGYFASGLIAQALPFDIAPEIIMVIFIAAALFVGLKGIKYVAPISTWLPLIPVAVLVWLLIKTIGTVGDFNPSALLAASKTAVIVETPQGATAGIPVLSQFGIAAFIVSYMIGFFATAGAAGVDFGANSRNSKDVQLGGLVGVSLMMILTGVAAVLILAGAYGNPNYAPALLAAGSPMDPTKIMSVILGDNTGKICMGLLALAAFPSACFASLISANSFKTMLPKINANVSVGIGGLFAIILAVTGIAGNASGVFGFIGASFGPICGAMLVDYLLSGGNWTGPRAGFNLAGWASWAVGFVVGVLGILGYIPMGPLWAFIVGAVVYWGAMLAGMKSEVLDFNK